MDNTADGGGGTRASSPRAEAGMTICTREGAAALHNRPDAIFRLGAQPVAAA